MNNIKSLMESDQQWVVVDVFTYKIKKIGKIKECITDRSGHMMTLSQYINNCEERDLIVDL